MEWHSRVWNKNATLTSEQACLSQAQRAKQKADWKWHKGRKQKANQKKGQKEEWGELVGGWWKKQQYQRTGWGDGRDTGVILQAQILKAAPEWVVQAAEGKKQSLRSRE